ncbi:MAG: CCA tRNA nucleotidyltransferase [Alphaproteobacteria bacterium]|jgi:poly(A) polymerase|nr:CCA tRNA nucleotidyltransferase [Alphaproteobacteria bacterium]
MKLNLEKFPLMGDQITQKLFQTFEKHGVYPRFVGGCVRDAILGVEAYDIDIAVPIPPDEIIYILTTDDIDSIPTGYEFGTITAVLEGRPFQITSLREDWETDGRHPRVTFGTDWEEDAARRDFTVNALYAERDGTVIDYFGGIEDLEAGIIRFVGDPDMRIREDYLRILRYFRFLAWYGHGPIEPQALQACATHHHGLKGLSRERIGHEFMKLLSAPKPLLSLTLLHQKSLDSFVVPQPLNLKAIEALLAFGEPTSVMCRLAALSLPNIDVKGASTALRLSRDQRQYLHDCVMRLDSYPSSERTIYRNLYQDGVSLFKDFTLLSLCVGSLSASASIQREAFKIAASWHSPTFPIQGKDLVDMGVIAGPKLGELLKACESWWIDQGFFPDREACLAWVRDAESQEKSK